MTDDKLAFLGGGGRVLPHPAILPAVCELEPWQARTVWAHPQLISRLEGVLFTGEVDGVELLKLCVGTRNILHASPMLLGNVGLPMPRSATVLSPSLGAMVEFRNPNPTRRRVCVVLQLTCIEMSW